ncbi:maleylacetate reductase [Actinomadura miaoliensis]|uniref:Maleylacetate reductase n=1 Tax=Actinomadura miaoliensis TaxID=430685 RepID=A0ABP7VBA8_9ACTN
MTLRFTFAPLPTRVVFGPGTLASVRAEVERAGFSRVLVLSTPGHRHLADRVAGLLGDLAAGTHPHAAMHVPAGGAERARETAARLSADGCVAIGGGSTIGLAKAIALSGGPAYVAVPTTYAGSEMTPVWGLTEHGRKRTGRDERVRPVAVVYDPDLTLTLPPETAVVSGVNALAHAVEALYAPNGSPIVDLMAAEAVRVLTANLPRLTVEPGDPGVRARTLHGAWLAGCCLGSTTMGLHHKLCHVLGGTFGLPHAQTHAVVLPYALAYNSAKAPKACAAIAQALGESDPVTALWTWTRNLGAPSSLGELGLTEDAIAPTVDLATRDAYPNPVPLDPGRLRALLEAAVHGAPPQLPSQSPLP